MLYPFKAILFVIMCISAIFVFCLDMIGLGIITAVCFVFNGYSVTAKTTECMVKVIDAALEVINDINSLSEDVLSKKRNKEKSNT